MFDKSYIQHLNFNSSDHITQIKTFIELSSQNVRNAGLFIKYKSASQKYRHKKKPCDCRHTAPNNLMFITTLFNPLDDQLTLMSWGLKVICILSQQNHFLHDSICFCLHFIVDHSASCLQVT